MIDSAFDTSNIEWIHLEAGRDFGYPIDYWIAVLGAQPETGCASFLVKWPPETYCHFHRHLGKTTSLVLEGEHQVLNKSDPRAEYSNRPAGYFANSEAGDLHLERSGPNGAVVLFQMQTSDGRLFEILDNDQKILNTVTVEDFALGRLR